MSEINIRYGFKIENGHIYDMRIQNYQLKAFDSIENIIYDMIPSNYKRLYLFEPLLEKYSIDIVFEMLNYNSRIKEDRANLIDFNLNKTKYISTMATVFNYPPTYLTKRKFYLYKICQDLKKYID